MQWSNISNADGALHSTCSFTRADICVSAVEGKIISNSVMNIKLTHYGTASTLCTAGSRHISLNTYSLRICLLVSTVSFANTAEAIEMLFGR